MTKTFTDQKYFQFPSITRRLVCRAHLKACEPEEPNKQLGQSKQILSTSECPNFGGQEAYR